jgi:hypothetical protein
MYEGKSDWLLLFGVGARLHHPARDAHVASGRKALLWDLGYFGREKLTGYMRASIDDDHPQRLLDQAPVSDSRWRAHGLGVEDLADPAGHVVLVGMGRKQRVYLGREDWERFKFAELMERFPDRAIVYRPKRSSDPVQLPCPRREGGSIREVLRGASLVVCRHSNVAVDAVIAGVPFEAEDGAAMWLKDKKYSLENRIEFLHRLSWFQWRPDEMPDAWLFLRGFLGYST